MTAPTGSVEERPVMLAARTGADLAPEATDVDARAVTTLRFLAADSVEAAQSGQTGSVDQVVGLEGFGASGPGPDVFAHFGFSPEAIAACVCQAMTGTDTGPGDEARTAQGDGDA
jgi:hypothetical protein